jgi:hypothetical protein
MSNPGTTQPILPSITGNAKWDGLIRGVLLSVSAAATATIVTWLNAHGFSDPNLQVMISGAIFTALSTVAIIVWGYINRKNAEIAAQNAMTAGVQAGIALAVNPSVPTPHPVAISPETAKAIVAAYGPKQEKP